VKNNIRCRRCGSLYARHVKKLVESWGLCFPCAENDAEIWALLNKHQLEIEKKVRERYEGTVLPRSIKEMI